MNDRLVHRLVSHRFPGYGKDAWTGRVVHGPDEHDRYEIAWDFDDACTKHKGSAVIKWLVEPMSKNAKLNHKARKTANKRGLIATHQKASKHSAARVKRSRGGVNRAEAASSGSSGPDLAELASISKGTVSAPVEKVDTMATVCPAEGAGSKQQLKLGGEEAVNQSQHEPAVTDLQGETAGCDAPPVAAKALRGDTGGESPFAVQPVLAADIGNSNESSPFAVQQVPVADSLDELPFADEPLHAADSFDESPFAVEPLYAADSLDESPFAVQPLHAADISGLDGSPFAVQAIHAADISSLDASPNVVQTLHGEPGDDAPGIVQAQQGETGRLDESSGVVPPLYTETGCSDEVPFAAHSLLGETASQDAIEANTTAAQKPDLSMAGSVQETSAPPTKRAMREWAEEPAFKMPKEKQEGTHLLNATSRAISSTPKADWCMFCERTTLTDAKRPTGDVLMCEADETVEAHLGCVDYEPFPSDTWYCPLCADEKDDAEDWAEEEVFLMKQRASPRRAVEICSRVKALVEYLQESYFAAVCTSLPHDDVAATQLLMSDRLAYQLYAKAIFWTGADGRTSSYPSRCVVNRVSADVAALITNNNFPNELPCNGNVDFISQAVATRWLEECERTAGRPLTAGETDAGEPEPLKMFVARGERQDGSIPSSDCMVPYPTESVAAPPLIDVLELAPATDAGSAVRVRQDVFLRLCERFNSWLDSQALGSFKILDEDDNKLQHVRQDTVASARPARVLPKKSSKRNPDSARQQRPNERKRRRHGELVCRVYVMLLRHGSVVRGDPAQHSMIPDTVMTLLRKWGCEGECFATPLNARMPAFCSPFADCDACFGSLGNFFDFWPLEGSFEANPPFFINNAAIVKHLAELLQRAQTACKPLSFVLIHTEEHHNICKQHSVFNSFIRSELLLEKDRHYYQEGAYFCRAQPSAYLPRFRSCVLFTATLEGTRKWPVTPDLLDGIEGAFAWPPPRQNSTKANAVKDPPATCSL